MTNETHSFTQRLNAIIETLSVALIDAEKFEKGNDAAGKRLRAVIQETKTALQVYRIEIQIERNSRKS